jgi:outer membrane protein
VARTLCTVVAILVSLLGVSAANADADAASIKTGWSGTAGIGPMVFPKYTGGKGTKTWLLPLVSASYNDMFYIEPLRAGVYLASSADRKLAFGLAVEPRFGLHSTDGARLTGMATRKDSLEGGLSFDWDADIVAINFSYLGDLTHSSQGTSARLYFYKELIKNGLWKFSAFAGADRLSAKVANYFFGVNGAEVVPGRPLYQPGATTNGVFGFYGSYKLSPRYSVVFGLQSTRLLGGAAMSPIVETKQANVGWAGFAWNL